MTTLRVIIDEMLSTAPGNVNTYTEELTRALIATAPRNCYVEAFVSASTEPEYELINERLPGLAALHKSALAGREVKAAWQHGFTRLPGHGMVHAPSLLAPLSRHDRLNSADQVIVTVHDTVAWSHPELLPPRVVSWHRAMLKRATRFADAVVAPSHAVADQLGEIADLGDRVRVISGAANSRIVPPADADVRASRLDLPNRYILAIGGLEAGKGIDQLVRSMSKIGTGEPLLIVGPTADDSSLAAAIVDAGLDEGRVRGLGLLSDADLAVVMERATVFAHPNLEEGFGMPMLDAFSLGIPVVHSDAPAMVELSAGGGIVVERGDSALYPERLADAIRSILDDRQLAVRLGYSGSDRANAFSWRSSAEKVWQLHADL
ncbi:glycosyltransferase involved in cell wall biosynthesis [Salinibacterium sp. CAN_S4]|uniref:glycosyltransferase family 4 protein n=1 Tax=Salinibacterium sp. CAN_S4 TaxID=2787727 RepID=UPI0018EFD922